MKSLRLRIEHTEETIDPMHAFVCESPDLDRVLLLEAQVMDGVETSLTYVEGDSEALEPALAEADRVEEYDVTPDEGGCFLYVRQTLRDRDERLMDAFLEETIVMVPPVEFRSDRSMHLSLVGHGEDLQAVTEALPDGMDVDVKWLGEYARAVDRVATLTDRQREAIDAAWAVGYYDVPRSGGIEAVADELDCANSTASALLRRAESRLVGVAIGAQ